MIYELKIKDPSKSCVPWWTNVQCLKGRKKITFKAGLNVLVGPNGSGKSTVLTTMARMLHCEQGGIQKTTWSSIRDVMKNEKLLKGVEPIHDGRPVVSFSPEKEVGLVGGSFDDDFMMQGVQNCMFRGSSGETTRQRLALPLMIILGHEKFPAVDMKHHSVPDSVKKFLAGNKVLPKGKRSRSTIILDEPDRSLDMNSQVGFWIRAAQATKSRLQIIVAAHSPLVFFIPGVNIIEMENGYGEMIKESIHSFLDEESLSLLIKISKVSSKSKKAQ